MPITPAVRTSSTILYEDEEVLAVDKPPMVAVHPSGRHLSDTLIQRVHARYGVARAAARRRAAAVPPARPRDERHRAGRQAPARARRDDAAVRAPRGGEGVPRDRAAARPTREARRDRAADSGRRARAGSQLKMTVVARRPSRRAPSGASSSRYRGCTLVACRPLTGRQHQIRVHLDGDRAPDRRRQALRAGRGLFQKAADGSLTRRGSGARSSSRARRCTTTAWRSARPRAGERIEVVSPLAPDLAAFLETR